MPQTFILLNTTVLGTTTFPAGSSIDGNSDPIDQLRAAGGVLIPPAYAPPALIAAAERALQARSRGASYQALDQIMLSGLGARTSQLGGGSIFIYREGETNPGGNVFSTLEDASLAAAQMKPGILMIDASLGNPILPAGKVIDLNGFQILGGLDGTPILTVQEGGKITGTVFSIDNVEIVSLSSEPVFEFDNGGTNFLTLNNAAQLQTLTPSSAPLVHVAAGSRLELALRYFSFILSYDVSAPILSVDLGGNADVFTDIAVAIYDNTLAGNGAIVVEDLTGIAVANRNPNLSHTQLGTNISYTYG